MFGIKPWEMNDLTAAELAWMEDWLAQLRRASK